MSSETTVAMVPSDISKPSDSEARQRPEDVNEAHLMLIVRDEDEDDSRCGHPATRLLPDECRDR